MNEHIHRPQALSNTAERLAGETPQTTLRWALETYAGRIVLACSFGGPTGMVLLDMVMQIDPQTPVYYLDTGLLFSDTHGLIERVSARYHIDPRAVSCELSVEAQNLRHGKTLWLRDPDACCNLRKVEPQRGFLKQYDAWIAGLRRDQSSTRTDTPVVGWDARFKLAKICPLAAWDERMVWDYIRDHDVPYNPLHDAGYPSVGCIPCTRAVAPGEDARAGRWAGSNKTECGLHSAPVQQ